MYYVYVLKSLKDKKLYIGKTSDLKKRMEYHNKGRVWATKARRPLILLFYEGFINRIDADREELFYKSGFGREALNSKLFHTVSTDS